MQLMRWMQCEEYEVMLKGGERGQRFRVAGVSLALMGARAVLGKLHKSANVRLSGRLNWKDVP